MQAYKTPTREPIYSELRGTNPTLQIRQNTLSFRKIKVIHTPPTQDSLFHKLTKIAIAWQKDTK